jgi:hypothetical protein
MKIAAFPLYLHQPKLATGRECKCQKIKLKGSTIRKLRHTIYAVFCYSNPTHLTGPRLSKGKLWGDRSQVTGDSNQWGMSELSLSKQVQNINPYQFCNELLTPASNLSIVWASEGSLQWTVHSWYQHYMDTSKNKLARNGCRYISTTHRYSTTH